MSKAQRVHKGVSLVVKKLGSRRAHHSARMRRVTESRRVVRLRDRVAPGLFFVMPREKNLSYPLTNAMHTMYQDTLYGAAARGCHHRGDGPDASQRPISHSRQRREDHLIGSCGDTHGVAEEASAEKDVDRVSPREVDRLTMEPRVHITEKEVHQHGC